MTVRGAFSFFRGQAKVQAKLKHPNLVAVTDVLDVEGSPGLLMEYVDGPSLRQWLERQRPDVEVAKAMFRAIVAGVARAHQAGVIHRDMKPGNVLVDMKDTGDTSTKLIDLGVDGIITDYPYRLRAVMAARGLSLPPPSPVSQP